MRSDPAKEVVIPLVPSTATPLCKEDPFRATRPHVHHYAIELTVFQGLGPILGERLVIFLPYGSLIPLATTIMDYHIWKKVVPVVRHQRIGDKMPERVVGLRAKYVVTEGAMASVSDPSREIKKGRKLFVTSL